MPKKLMKNKRIKKPKNKSKGQKPRAPNVGMNMFGLSSCAAHYALAVGSPFSRESNGACVPTFPARMSQKVTVYKSGSFAVGLQTFGFLGVAPCVANNATVAYASTNAYNGSSIDYLNAIGVQSFTIGSIPYTSTTLTNGDAYFPSAVSGRIVSVGVRIRYIGTELNRGGMIYALVTPDHNNTQGFSMDNITAYSETIKVPVGRNWTTLVASAIDQDECSYPEEVTAPGGPNTDAAVRRVLYPFAQQNSVNSAAPTIGAPIMVFCVSSTPGNVFEFEIVEHIEYIGSLTQPAATRSHSDQDGLSKVTEAAGNTPAARAASGAPQESTFLQQLKKTLYEHRDIIVPLSRMAAQMYVGTRRPNLRAIQNGYGL